MPSPANSVLIRLSSRGASRLLRIVAKPLTVLVRSAAMAPKREVGGEVVSCTLLTDAVRLAMGLLIASV